MHPTANEPIKILYMVGTGRSGTTLLSRLLQAEPGYTALGEVQYLSESECWPTPCGCGTPHEDCPTWQRLIDSLRDPGAFVEWRTAVRASQREQLRSFARTRPAPAALRPGLRRLHGVYRSFATPETVLVDESKRPWLGYLLAQQPWADVRFIELVRHPDLVVHSWKQPKAYLPTFDAEGVARNWLRVHTTAEVVRRRSGRPWLRLAFSRLIDEPHDALTQILGAQPRSLSRPDGRWVFSSPPNHIYFSNADKLKRGYEELRPHGEHPPRSDGPWQRAARTYWERWLSRRANTDRGWSAWPPR